jgi:hypothetical protein
MNGPTPGTANAPIPANHPSAPPTVRITVFIPLATPVW